MGSNQPFNGRKEAIKFTADPLSYAFADPLLLTLGRFCGVLENTSSDDDYSTSNDAIKYCLYIFRRLLLVYKASFIPMTARERLKKKQAAILFNIGSITAYAGMFSLLIHAATNYQQRQPVAASEFGFVILFLISQLLAAPYKWDKLWLRIKTLIYISVFSAVAILYLLSGIQWQY